MMDNKYSPTKVEPKWQKFWEKGKLFEAKDFDKKPKNYILIEFPYPSGEGLHIGHCRSYTALDIVARKKRMEGYNVLFPIGWDAFGLPTENYAIKTGIHPKVATKKNTDTFRRQLKSLGFSFDWSREINTTDPGYYKWTQWIFLKLYEHGLAYKAKIAINFCPSCKIGLANEEVIDGKCERCGTEVIKKEIEQWMLKITKYADRLIKDLDKVDYLEKIKQQQINWIGRSEGAEIIFKIKNINEIINVFTTRPDTLFGATYMVLSPEHEVISKFKSQISNLNEVENYIKSVEKKSELERTDEKKEKTGVELKGVKAINPVNNKEIPIFVADYVLSHYGTGAIMAVPAHDQRDFEFAKKYKLPIKMVICPNYPKPFCPILTKAYEKEGHLVGSGDFDGLSSSQAIEKITKWLEKKKLGKFAVNYKLRDWVFSRQHYWGEPIPIIYCEKCGEVPVSEKDLPVKLPMVEKYQPTDTGESPLANVKDWVNTKCPKCGGPAKRETDTMPNWAGSSWYYLTYTTLGTKKEKRKTQKNENIFIDNKKEIGYWMPVDWYNGGMEHTTLHLLYSRFWYKFLFDIKIVPQDEPYQKRTSHGMVLGEGGIKMSKSRGNVVNPDEIVNTLGTDTLRIYEMFMGPFDEIVTWDPKGILGVRRFLDRVWRLFNSENKSKISEKLNIKLHQTIKKVKEDIESMGFNTAISAMMEFLNLAQKESVNPKEIKSFMVILSPFAPHLAEELWSKLGHKKSIFLEKWPKYDGKFIAEEKITIIIQVNGKLRDKILVSNADSDEKIKKLAVETSKIKAWLKNQKIKKIVYVPKKLINIVI